MMLTELGEWLAFLQLKTANSKTQLTSTHLLGDHDDERSQSGTSHSRDGEELDKSADVIGVLADQGRFHAELGVDVVQVTSRLELGVSEFLQRAERVEVFALLDVPTWRFWVLVRKEGGT